MSAVESIKHYFENDKVYVLTGVLADKDYRFIAKKLSEVAARAFTITPDNKRALKASDYAAVLSGFGIPSEHFSDIKGALAYAVEEAKRNGKALISLGSLYTYVDVIREIEN